MKRKWSALLSIVLSVLMCWSFTGVALATDEDVGECTHSSYHKEVEYEEEATCTEDGYQEVYTSCDICGEELEHRTVIVKATGHSYGKPVFEWTSNGKSCDAYTQCSKCDELFDKSCKVTSKVKKAATYAADGSIEYTATVKFGSKNYTSKKTVKISKQTVSKVKLSSVTSKKANTLTAKWSKNGKATGYEVQYATAKSFKGAKKIIIKKNSTVSTNINKLKKGKKYYVRVRAYKTLSKKNYYSDWSAVKSVSVGKATGKKSTKTSKSTGGISDSTTVYISSSGKIHTRSDCSGMKHFTKMTYGKAKNKYNKCKNCFH